MVEIDYMKEYKIEITETNSKVVTIEAESESDAMAIVKAAYEEGEIEITEENDYVDVNYHFV